MVTFTTGGESHGKSLVAIMQGLPAGLPLQTEVIDRDLRRRQQGYGRGARMKIEQDHAQILSGVRHGFTLGSPIALLIENKDWTNWSEVMASAEAVETQHARELKRPRPGHADLAGGMKFDMRDLRNVLERASARETAARVACGSIAKQLLHKFHVEIRSHVIQLGGVPEIPLELEWDAIASIPDGTPLNCADDSAQEQMIALIGDAKTTGDTLGGVFEVVSRRCIPGLGSHTSWDRKLDGRLAQALMSIPAVKAVSIGQGLEVCSVSGSQAHDEIFYDNDLRQFIRKTNRAGGLEGGITNGEEVRLRGYMKPISTLRRSLSSVHIDTKQEARAAFERSDITAVPAAGVVGEAMVALVLADAMIEKFGGDSVGEMQRNFNGYLQQLKDY
ncbi:MAG TPA: chorismate synthase [Pyrinomonadaceae bacterium]|nr:chorismate synthase [Pyrinomonadaceae bacterium]